MFQHQVPRRSKAKKSFDRYLTEKIYLVQYSHENIPTRFNDGFKSKAQWQPWADFSNWKIKNYLPSNAPINVWQWRIPRVGGVKNIQCAWSFVTGPTR